GDVADLDDELSRVTQGRLRHADLDPDGVLAVVGEGAAGQAKTGAGLVDRVALAGHRVAAVGRAVEGVAESAAGWPRADGDDRHGLAFETAARGDGDDLDGHLSQLDGADLAARLGADDATLVGVGGGGAVGVADGIRALERQHGVGGAAVVLQFIEIDRGAVLDVASRAKAARAVIAEV